MEKMVAEKIEQMRHDACWYFDNTVMNDASRQQNYLIFPLLTNGIKFVTLLI